MSQAGLHATGEPVRGRIVRDAAGFYYFLPADVARTHRIEQETTMLDRLWAAGKEFGIDEADAALELEDDEMRTAEPELSRGQCAALLKWLLHHSPFNILWRLRSAAWIDGCSP